jgi:hypothetical protein
LKQYRPQDQGYEEDEQQSLKRLNLLYSQWHNLKLVLEVIEPLLDFNSFLSIAKGHCDVWVIRNPHMINVYPLPTENSEETFY